MSAWIETLASPEIIGPLVGGVVIYLANNFRRVSRQLRDAIGTQNGHGNVVEISEQLLVELAKVRVSLGHCETSLGTLEARVDGLSKEFHHVRDRLDEHGDLIAAQIKRN